MSAFSAKVVQHSINQLLINTINDAEKMLLDLPRDGDKVEVITSSSHEVKSHSACGFKSGKTTQDVVVETMTPSQKSDELQRKLGYPDASSTGTTDTPSNQDTSQVSSGQNDATAPVYKRSQNKVHDGEVVVSPEKVRVGAAIKKVIPDDAEIVPGSIQVSPLRQMAGIIIDLIVMIKMKSGGSRSVNMQIECPDFVPKRIRVDGNWHLIV